MSEQVYDAIVIGAGLGGLTTAALLAKKGARVLVLEQHYVVGGCASSFRRHQFVFDAAVHLIGGLEEGGVLNNVLKELDVFDQLNIRPVSPMYKVQVGQEMFDIPADPDRLAEVLAARFPSDEEAIFETLQEFKEIGSALLTWSDLSKRIQGRIMAMQNMSIREYLEDRFINSKVEFLLASLYPYIGATPAEISAPFYMTTLMSYKGGSFYLEGSTQQLSNVLRASLERDGGKVVLNRRVEQILIEEGKVSGVRDHKGNVYRAPMVVSNVDLRKTYLSMVGEEALSPLMAKEIKSLKPSISALVLYAAIKNDGWEKQFAHETFVFPTYENNAKCNQYNPLDPQSKPWVSICCPSHADPTLAPEGHSLVSFMVPCDGETMEKLRAEHGKEALQEAYLNLLESHLPGLRERIVLSELATPRTIERFTGNGNGALYGWKKSMDQQKRLENVSRSFIPGLHAVGHWTKYGHGVFGAMNGARLLVPALQEELNLIKA